MPGEAGRALTEAIRAAALALSVKQHGGELCGEERCPKCGGVMLLVRVAMPRATGCAALCSMCRHRIYVQRDTSEGA